MPRKSIDLTGRVFGRLTVVEQVPIKGGRNAKWRCVCACVAGRFVVVTSLRLRSGHTTSCGCLRQDVMRVNQERRTAKALSSKTDTDIAISRVLRSYRLGAQARRLDFKLNRSAFAELILADCAYCGAAPEAAVAPRAAGRGVVLVNGIDRLDSSQGYVRGNVVSCCKHCNRAKLGRTPEEFIAHCRAIVSHQEGKS